MGSRTPSSPAPGGYILELPVGVPWIGITGSRRLPPGRIWEVRETLAHRVEELSRQEGDRMRPVVVTGGANGIDAIVAEHAKEVLGCHVHTVLPADMSQVEPSWRGHCTTYEVMPKGTSHLDRNQRMVDLVAEHGEPPVFLAWPYDEEHLEPRSGTWATVRRARKRSIIHPTDVRLLRENPPQG